MIDAVGRSNCCLRVSVTDHCDFRCVYCKAEDMTFLPKAEILSLEELDRLCGAFVASGLRKLRLTGGEPLVRRNVMSLVRGLSRHLASGALDKFDQLIEWCGGEGFDLTLIEVMPMGDIGGENWPSVEFFAYNRCILLGCRVWSRKLATVYLGVGGRP